MLIDAAAPDLGADHPGRPLHGRRPTRKHARPGGGFPPSGLGELTRPLPKGALAPQLYRAPALKTREPVARPAIRRSSMSLVPTVSRTCRLRGQLYILRQPGSSLPVPQRVYTPPAASLSKIAQGRIGTTVRQCARAANSFSQSHSKNGGVLRFDYGGRQAGC